jgi:hypothetical protein
MSAGAEQPMPDSMTTDAKLMKVHRDLPAKIDSLPDDDHRTIAQWDLWKSTKH